MHTPHYIEGVHNYCDKWCEKCRLASRCKLFAMEQRTKGAADPARAMEEFIDEQEAQLEPGDWRPENEWMDFLDDSSELPQEFLDAEEAREFLVDVDVLSTSSMTYSQQARAWFERLEKLDKGRKKHGDRAASLPGLDSQANIKRACNAVEIIHWYLFQIHVKLQRALGGDDELEEELAAEGFPKDSDGSAKVALIGMDRSIAAWGYLRQHMPAEREKILPILLRLNRLRRETEKRFPHARAFRRPGFDD